MCVCAKSLKLYLFVTQWTVVPQPPLSMGFFRQEHWSGLPCPSPGYLPNAGIDSMFLRSPALAGRFFTTITTWEALQYVWVCVGVYIYISAVC